MSAVLRAFKEGSGNVQIDWAITLDGVLLTAAQITPAPTVQIRIRATQAVLETVTLAEDAGPGQWGGESALAAVVEQHADALRCYLTYVYLGVCVEEEALVEASEVVEITVVDEVEPVQVVDLVALVEVVDLLEAVSVSDLQEIVQVLEAAELVSVVDCGSN